MQEETKIKKLTQLKSIFKNSARVTKILWQDRPGLIMSLVLVLTIAALLPFIASFLNGQMINELVSLIGDQNLNKKLIVIVALLICSHILQPLIYSLQTYKGMLLWHHIEYKFEELILKKRAEIDIANYENPKLHDSFQKITEGGTWRINNLAERQFYLLQNLMEVAIASVILTQAEWWLLPLIMLGVMPELWVETKYGQKKWSIYDASAATKRKFWELRGHFTHLPSLAEVKLLQTANKFLSEIKNLFYQFKTKEQANERTRIGLQLGANSFGQLIMATGFIWFIYQTVRGEIGLGDFTFLISSMASLRSAISGMFSNIARQYEDNLFVNDVFKIMDLPPFLPKTDRPEKLATKGAPKIIFQNVSFSYPGSDKVILKNINLTLEAGKKLAIVGVNGAGKTTLVKLLCRFYDPTEGQILLDGKDLKTFKIEDWQSRLGVLFQDYAHYNFPVQEAISVGKIDHPLNLPAIKHAAKESEALKFIQEWPDKWQQQLGREFANGIEPSIGQWQKLALARIFYRNANVWILDEPTASVDAESEAKIFEKLERLPKDRTVILISHRFSTVRSADEIIVLKNGQLTEKGNHEELMQKNSDYTRLFNLQASKYQ